MVKIIDWLVKIINCKILEIIMEMILNVGIINM